MSRTSGKRSSSIPDILIRRFASILRLSLVCGLVGALASELIAEIAPSRPPAALMLESVSVWGSGQNTLLLSREDDLGGEGSSMPFTEPGSVPIENPVWVRGSRPKPFSFVGGSRPRFTVSIQVIGQLPAGTEVRLSGRDPERTHRALTTEATAWAGGRDGEILIFELMLAQPLDTRVAHERLALDWQARIGEESPCSLGQSSNTILVTHQAPFGEGRGAGGGVSYRRLGALTRLAEGRRAPVEIVAALGPVLTSATLYDLRRGITATEIGGDPFAVLDGIRADCRTLSKLLERSLGLLGVPGARVMYVFPRTGTWDGLSSSVASHSQQAEVRVDLYGTRELGVLYFHENGPNRYQACCVWVGNDQFTGQRVEQWWMGGKGSYRATDFDVLMASTLPNRRNQRRQYYVDILVDERMVLHDGPVPYPDLPSVWGMSAEAALKTLDERGYRNVVIVYRKPWFAWMSGYVRHCHAPGSPDSLPVSPHARVVVEVYRS